MPVITMQPPLRKIFGQPSFTLTTSTVEVAITQLGAMLAPVTFFADSDAPISPYAVAPWWSEVPSASPLLRGLRGDFFCSAFGDNDEPWAGRSLPPHGDTANQPWHCVRQISTHGGSALRLALDLPTQGGCCTATTVLLDGHQFIYQRHDLSDLGGPFNPGHHAMLKCPPEPGAAALSFSPHVLVSTPPEHSCPVGRKQHTLLRPGCEAKDASCLEGANGSRIDATRFPGVAGVDGAFMVCADPIVEYAWSAATFPDARYVWLSLRKSEQLPATFVWLSNGGRCEPPWNSRHVGVLGLEDMMGYYCAGLAASARANELNERGIATCMNVSRGATASIAYIQGVARIPNGFDVVAAVTPVAHGELLITSRSGCEVRVPCHWEFLADARVPYLCAD